MRYFPHFSVSFLFWYGGDAVQLISIVIFLLPLLLYVFLHGIAFIYILLLEVSENESEIE